MNEFDQYILVIYWNKNRRSFALSYLWVIDRNLSCPAVSLFLLKREQQLFKFQINSFSFPKTHHIWSCYNRRKWRKIISQFCKHSKVSNRRRMLNELTLIFSLSTTTVLIIKSTPIVAPWPGGNTPCVNRRTRHVLPSKKMNFEMVSSSRNYWFYFEILTNTGISNQHDFE